MSSSMGQANGKKAGSGASSAANTPASTPVASVPTVSNGQSATQTTPPPNNNAPKYGTLVPNRIFVGGISANTTENELMQLFSNYGTVKAAKIIQDRAGVSKGYGFITFESEDDAKRLQRESDNIVLRERKLNIAPAIKKQQSPLQTYGRAFDGASPPAVAAGNPQYYFPGSIPFFQSNLYYPTPTPASGDPATQQAPMYQAPTVYPTQSGPPQTSPYPPMIFPAQPMYMPQQYPMPMPYEYNYYPNGGPQYVVGGQGGPQSQVPAAMQRPGSPPRQPCYGQQLSYAPAEAVYYNVPMYGTMEGAPVYQDSVDVPNGTPLPEEYTVVERHHNTPNTTATPTQQLPPAAAAAGGVAIVQQQDVVAPDGFHQGAANGPSKAGGGNPSSTPVVSLLSETHKVKDVTSMQSGRRRKSSADGASSANPGGGQALASANGYHHHQNFYVPPGHYGAAFNVPPFPYDFGYGLGKFANGQEKVFRRRNNNRNANCDRKSLESSSLSSGLRTDSNSSASVAEEKTTEGSGSEAKAVTTGVDTPPPAPYSPMTHSQYGNAAPAKFGGGSISNYHQSHPHHHHHHQHQQQQQHQQQNYHHSYYASNHRNHSSTRGGGRVAFSSGSRPTGSPRAGGYSSHSSGQQVHAGGGGGGGGGSQHFIPPVRRARRSVRRNAPAVNEIGAGDAPLPGADVADACKKLDGLKL